MNSLPPTPTSADHVINAKMNSAYTLHSKPGGDAGNNNNGISQSSAGSAGNGILGQVPHDLQQQLADQSLCYTSTQGAHQHNGQITSVSQPFMNTGSSVSSSGMSSISVQQQQEHTAAQSGGGNNSNAGATIGNKRIRSDDRDSDGDSGAENTPKGADTNSNPDKRAGRRKINIEYIEDKSRRHITFSKRKTGIMKKAFELSTLTGTQVLLIVVSETGLVYTFTTPKLQPIVTKPEGKNLIQSCLNTPDFPDQMPSAQDPNAGYIQGGRPHNNIIPFHPDSMASVDQQAPHPYDEEQQRKMSVHHNTPPASSINANYLQYYTQQPPPHQPQPQAHNGSGTTTPTAGNSSAYLSNSQALSQQAQQSSINSYVPNHPVSVQPHYGQYPGNPSQQPSPVPPTHTPHSQTPLSQMHDMTGVPNIANINTGYGQAPASVGPNGHNLTGSQSLSSPTQQYMPNYWPNAAVAAAAAAANPNYQGNNDKV
ncbi:transcription factor of the MADS box [Mycoemilia scoparia]|uniref:Transcription factor of the MADS box n=1 Tax=Mycoemilia scoparia TaxID=417184 RepID=A0A9W8A0E8_9FUNG|nr:transcription factor of the MADS box [Mycoemilia scoparia]